MGLDLTKYYENGDLQEDGAIALSDNTHTPPKKLFATVRGSNGNGQKNRKIGRTNRNNGSPDLYQVSLNADQRSIYDLIQETCTDIVDFETARELGIKEAGNHPPDSLEVVSAIKRLSAGKIEQILNTFEMSTASQRAEPLLEKYSGRRSGSHK